MRNDTLGLLIQFVHRELRISNFVVPVSGFLSPYSVPGLPSNLGNIPNVGLAAPLCKGYQVLVVST
jgi:hypothetical protein